MSMLQFIFVIGLFSLVSVQCVDNDLFAAVNKDDPSAIEKALDGGSDINTIGILELLFLVRSVNMRYSKLTFRTWWTNASDARCPWW